MLPFIDLLDLLFKKQMFISLQAESKDTSIVKPTQDYNSIFPGSKFKLFCAFRSLEDFIGWQWIDKLSELSKKTGEGFFECISCVPSDVNLKGIVNTKERFNAQFFKKHISKNVDKIWICGPPVMQAQIYNNLKVNGIDMQKIVYV